MALFEAPKTKIQSNLLSDRFIIPPFSTLDTRQSYWQKRKALWKKLTGDLSVTRTDIESGRIFSHNLMNFDPKKNTYINGGTSNFDPVLAEIMMRWFCCENSKILDPFGGEQTKGLVAGVLGYNYVGVEIRQDQVDLNNQVVKDFDKVKYICGDSTKISELITDRDFDVCITSPPYYSLETYSKEDLSALGTYDEFMQMYKCIFKQCISMLKDNAWLIIKIADIRADNGAFYGFVADNIKLFQELGLHFYNDAVLINITGTAGIRANRQFYKPRKMVKAHQNVLVFYKGEPSKVADTFSPVEFNAEELEWVY